jgi:hypothetical protein
MKRESAGGEDGGEGGGDDVRSIAASISAGTASDPATSSIALARNSVDRRMANGLR